MSVDTFNNSNCIHVNQHLSYPINVCSSASDDIDDDAKVIISNVSSNKRSRKSFKAQALNHLVKTEDAMFAGLPLDTYDAIADSGATQIFVMDGTPVINKRPTTRPLNVALADGRIVLSTHKCVTSRSTDSQWYSPDTSYPICQLLHCLVFASLRKRDAR